MALIVRLLLVFVVFVAMLLLWSCLYDPVTELQTAAADLTSYPSIVTDAPFFVWKNFPYFVGIGLLFWLFISTVFRERDTWGG